MEIIYKLRMYVTRAQIKAAAALLELSQSKLCEKVGISVGRMSPFWSGSGNLSAENMKKIIKFLYSQGIEFIGEDGVRKVKKHVTEHTGRIGFRNIVDEVYENARDFGDDICIMHVGAGRFKDWLGDDWWEMHAKRMTEIKDKFRLRVLHAEKDSDTRIAQNFGEYRCLPENKMTDRSIYVYSTKVCLIYKEDPIKLRVINDQDFSILFRNLFDIAWGVAN